MTEAPEQRLAFMDAWSLLIARFQYANERLSDFRRHPDYKIALEKASEKHRHLFVCIENDIYGLPEKNVEQLFNLADKEFVEDLIRRGY